MTRSLMHLTRSTAAAQIAAIAQTGTTALTSLVGDLRQAQDPPPAPPRAAADCGDPGQGGRAAGQAPRRPRPARHPHPIHLPRHVRRPATNPKGWPRKRPRRIADIVRDRRTAATRRRGRLRRRCHTLRVGDVAGSELDRQSLRRSRHHREVPGAIDCEAGTCCCTKARPVHVGIAARCGTGDCRAACDQNDIFRVRLDRCSSMPRPSSTGFIVQPATA